MSNSTARIDLSFAFRPLAGILMAYGLLKFTADPDLWGHVKFGLDTLRDRSLSSTDPYSFTQDIPWINHEWLSELMMGAAWKAGGSLGLFALKASLAGGAYYVAYQTLRGIDERTRWIALSLTAWGTLPIVWTLRPQLWTLLLLAILCRILVTGRGFAIVPALFVVWVNVHGGWILGLGVLLAWSATHMLWRGRTPTSRSLAAISAMSVVATLVNPYGWELWQFIGATVRLSRDDIIEWAPLWAAPWPLVIWIPTVVFAVWIWISRGRPLWPALAVIGMLGVASMNVLRLVPLFTVATAIFLGGGLPQMPATRIRRDRLVVDLVAIGLAAILSVPLGAVPKCVAMDRTIGPDVGPVEALKAARATGRMITTFNWGEYAIWHLSPHLKVSMDGRRETVYSEARLNEQYAIAFGRAEGLTALARIRPEYVWLSSDISRPTAEWLEDNDYRIDIENDRSFLAVRADLPVVAPATFEPTGCFPGP